MPNKRNSAYYNPPPKKPTAQIGVYTPEMSSDVSNSESYLLHNNQNRGASESNIYLEPSSPSGTGLMNTLRKKVATDKKAAGDTPSSP